MTIRARIAIMLAVALTVAGSTVLVINSIALSHTDFPTWSAYRDALLAEMNVSREGAVRAIDENPELLFDAPVDEHLSGSRPTINQASEAVQDRAIDRARERSRRWTAIAFVCMTLSALIVAWLLAGRLLRPLRLITARVREASGSERDVRVGLEGPNDEIKELADTFDEMLDRVGRSVDRQRRFSDQVCHEMRTPLAITRTEIDLLLEDVEDGAVRERLTRVADATGRAERLVARLLVLSRTENDDLDLEPFALDDMVGNLVGRSVEGPEWRAIRVDLELEPTSVRADRALAESLVRNLVDNASRHNRPGGWVRVAVHPNQDAEWSDLEVSNSIARRTGDRVGDGSPPGSPHIGLTIVEAVLDAHEGAVQWTVDDDSVTATVRLPASDRVTI